jgi:hypothetical protein
MGITLGPGEQISLPIDLQFDPEMQELINRGIVTLEIRQGPTTQTSETHYLMEFTVLLDGRPYRTGVIEWDSVPVSWWERIRKMFRIS